MFLRHILDVTDWINPDGHNYLAVCVHPPDHPGQIPPQGGQGGDHEVSRVFSCVVTYNLWAPKLFHISC